MFEKHAAATVYVVAKIDGKYRVFLHEHAKRGFWLGLGGHVELNESPPEAALREAREEAKFKHPEIVSDGEAVVFDSSVKVLPQPMLILEEEIPARGDAPEHHHIDYNYAARADQPQEGHTAKHFQWFSADELLELKAPGDVRWLARRALELIAGRTPTV